MTNKLSEGVEKRLRNLAYKMIPLPSGCVNCWGDLHEGCSDECLKSGFEHDKKLQDFVAGMLIEIATAKREERKEILVVLNSEEYQQRCGWRYWYKKENNPSTDFSAGYERAFNDIEILLKETK